MKILNIIAFSILLSVMQSYAAELERTDTLVDEELLNPATTPMPAIGDLSKDITCKEAMKVLFIAPPTSSRTNRHHIIFDADVMHSLIPEDLNEGPSEAYGSLNLDRFSRKQVRNLIFGLRSIYLQAMKDIAYDKNAFAAILSKFHLEVPCLLDLNKQDLRFLSLNSGSSKKEKGTENLEELKSVIIQLNESISTGKKFRRTEDCKIRVFNLNDRISNVAEYNIRRAEALNAIQAREEAAERTVTVDSDTFLDNAVEQENTVTNKGKKRKHRN